jgi:CheY-like chemotaxis protein
MTLPGDDNRNRENRAKQDIRQMSSLAQIPSLEERSHAAISNTTRRILHDASASNFAMTASLRHPPSRELWQFCFARLRELRGHDARERDLAEVLGFEHSRLARWKRGQIYIDRATQLVRLADALGIRTQLLVELAVGILNAEQAQARMRCLGQEGNDNGRAGPRNVHARDIATDASRFAIDPARFKSATHGTVLLVASSGADLGEVLTRHPETGALIVTSFSVGLCLAERHRPELVLLDLGLASDQAFDGCHALAGLRSRSQLLCRVVAGTSTVTDDITRAAFKAGAASVVLFPFARAVLEDEIHRLAERIQSQGAARE